MMDRLCSHRVLSSSSLLIFFVLFSQALAAASCSSQYAQPIVLPVTNVTLSSNVIVRGAPVSVGTPAQRLSFLPNGAWNDTYVYDASTTGCSDQLTPNACAGTRGGFFDEGASTSYNKLASQAAAHTATEFFPDHKNDAWGTDALEINSTLSLNNFAFGVNRGTVDNQNVLGLGRNSSLFNALVSKGAIASRTYSYWEGWAGADPDDQMEGSLILGGYDAAKVSGDNLTLPLSIENDCQQGYIVTISDIKMNLANGSNPSILPATAGKATRACIATGYPMMTLSEDIWNLFVQVSGVTEVGRSGGINFWGMLVDSNASYTGNLTFTFSGVSGGLDITIPNHQLVRPDFNYSPQGIISETNGSTTREVLINSLQDVNKNDMPLLGRAFLTSAYLSVDLDHSQFTLSAVNPTNKNNVVPIGPPACEKAKPLSPGATTSSSASASASAEPTSNATSAPSHSGISKGAIAGAAVGGVAIFAVACAGALLLLRRRRRPQKQVPQQAFPQMGIDKRDTSRLQGYGEQDHHGTYKPEMGSGHENQPPAELPLQKHTPYQTAPYEM